MIGDSDSIDQWGVSVGKALAKRTAAELADTAEPVLRHDSYTNARIGGIAGRAHRALGTRITAGLRSAAKPVHELQSGAATMPSDRDGR